MSAPDDGVGSEATAPLLRVRGLDVTYTGRGGVVAAVRAVDLDVATGEIVGLIGASGCGKSTLASALIGGLGGQARVRGSIRFDGRELVGAGERAWAAVRGRAIALIPQDPSTALNPCRRIGSQMMEIACVLQGARRRQARLDATAALERVRLADAERAMAAYPHELSIGQRQRVVIAMALLARPRLLLLDEPTASLDTTVAAAVVDLLAELATAGGPGQLLISHSLGLVRRICSRLLVIDGGHLVESGPTQRLIAAPRHGVTARLIATARLPEPRRPVATAADGAAAMPAVEAERLGKSYTLPADSVPRWLGLAPRRRLLANRDLSFTVAERTIVGVVGESGCGKSTLAKVLIGLETATSGRAIVQGTDVARRDVRGRPAALRAFVQMVFQSPAETLNPRRSIGAQLRRAIRLLDLRRADGRAPRRRARTDEAAAERLLARVHLPAEFLNRRPAELSGGQRQRIAIARALAGRPGLLLADEPFSALDGGAASAIARLLDELRQAGTATLLISHDLAALRGLADQILVMLGGTIVESGDGEAVFAPPYHPYTEALLSAMPSLDDPPAAQSGAASAPGQGPSAARGCVFADRCPRRLGPVCDEVAPPLIRAAPGHHIRCHLPLQAPRPPRPTPASEGAP